MYNPDIIGICESWLKNSVNLTAFNNDYQVFRNDRPDTIGNGGGTLIAVKSHLCCQLVTKLTVNKCECIFIDVKSNESVYTRYALVYRPPDTSLDDSVELYNIIYDHLKSVKMYILLGDFNLPDISWSNFVARSNISREFLTLCFKLGAVQCVDFPTREDNILDLVLCSTKFLLNSISCEPPFSTSDHASILCYLANHKNANHGTTAKPCFKKADYAVINAFLATIDWNAVYADCVSIEDYWDAFKGILNTAIYNFVPFVESKRRKHVPWFNRTLKSLHRIKQTKWKKYSRSRNVVTHAEYKAAATNFKREFLVSKCNFEKHLFKTDNSKAKFYGYVKSQTSVCNSIPCLKRQDGSLAFTDYEKACEFNEYFASVFVRDNGILPAFSTTCSDSLNYFSCSQRDIVKVVRKLKNSSSPGPDGLNVFFLKMVLAVIVNPLCTMFNVSLNHGTLPSDWKTAYIIPIFKKGDAQKASQYRPISLTSVICKILERVVREKLLDYVMKNNIVPKEQHGFIPKKSTVTNLLECLNDWSQSFDNGRGTNVVYLDYSKCFDSVCHSKLLFKLSKYGIAGPALTWLGNFLTNRVQSVKVNNTISPSASVMSGVPQGTVLGPILFLLYSADLPAAVSHCKISMYADDTKIYKEITNIQDCLLLQQDLDSITNWAETWQMSLNPDKTKMLNVGKSKVSYTYTLNGGAIEQVDHMKDIGVIVQSNLKFTMHCTDIMKKALYVTRTIFTTFKFHDFNFYTKMYVTYVRPILDYASQAWSPLLKVNIDRIESVQRYYTRRICPNNLSYNERLALLQLDSLEVRRIKCDLSLFFKLLSGSSIIEIGNSYSFTDRRRGNSKNLYVHFCRTDKRKLFWINRIVPQWNCLSEEIVSSINTKSFKHKLNCINFVGRGSLYC